MTRGAVLAMLIAVTTSAQAAPLTVWEQALADDEAKLLATRKAQLMASADNGVAAALTMAESRTTIVRQFKFALDQYRQASALDPADPEPYYRLAHALITFSDDCSPEAYSATVQVWCKAFTSAAEGDRIKREAALNFFEFAKRSGVDARQADAVRKVVDVSTKLGTPDDLRRARAAYEAILRGELPGISPITVSNYAEVLMMLGDLPNAILQYEAALSGNVEVGTALGYAVALDRSGRKQNARSAVRQLAEQALHAWELSVREGSTYYVPAGEVFYYRGLVAEAQGDAADAIGHYEAFIASGAHPHFAAAARANIAALRRGKQP